MWSCFGGIEFLPEVLTFKIEDFEGPLDLLLYLVGKNKMNLYDVNIMELIEQYTAAIREMQQDRMEISASSSTWRRIWCR